MVKGYITRSTDDSTTKEASYVMSARIISHETGEYLRGIVGIDRWVDLAIALKSYADQRPAKSDNNLDNVYLMLMGYALEDLAKSIILCRAYDAKPLDVSHFEEKLIGLQFNLKNGGKCKIETHELHLLFQAADLGFLVSPVELSHLEHISRYTKWKGRYPVPLDITGVPSSEPSFEDMAYTATKIYERAMAEVQALRTSHS